MATSGDLSTELARERNRAAADRTLMAWIRTALSLIGFGFTIAKGYDYLQALSPNEQLDAISSPLLFGGSFIVLGMAALFVAIVQHVNILNQISEQDFSYGRIRPITLVVAVVLFLIGALGLVALFL